MVGITRNQVGYWHDDVRLTRKEVAAILCCRPKLLEEWATDGVGPPFEKMGRFVRYRLGDLRAWMRSIKREMVQRRGVRVIADPARQNKPWH